MASCVERVTRWQHWATPGERPIVWLYWPQINDRSKFIKWFSCFLPIFLGSRYTSCLYRPSGALNNSMSARACRQHDGCNKTHAETHRYQEEGSSAIPKLPTWVVAVMDNTNVGTVEQLRFRRRPWETRADSEWNALQKLILIIHWSAAVGGCSLTQSKKKKDRTQPLGGSELTHTPEGHFISKCQSDSSFIRILPRERHH